MKKLMNNKKGITIQAIITGIVLFSFVLVSFFVVYNDMAPNYGVETNESTIYESTFYHVQNVSDITREVGDNIDTSEATVTDNVVSFLTLPYKGLKIMYGSWNILLSLASAIKAELPIPDIVYAVFITLALLAVIIAILSAILQGR